MYHIDTSNPSSSVFKMEAYSGATCHYFKIEHSYYLKKLKQLYNGPKLHYQISPLSMLHIVNSYF